MPELGEAIGMTNSIQLGIGRPLSIFNDIFELESSFHFNGAFIQWT